MLLYIGFKSLANKVKIIKETIEQTKLKSLIILRVHM